MSYHHITPIERGKIEALSSLGYSCRAIAKRINRHPSSVAREIRRAGEAASYTAAQAQEDYTAKRKNSKPQGKCRQALVAVIKEKLEATWSPEQIANTVTLSQVCFRTIYNWLYAGKLEGVTVSNLRRKGKKRSCRNLDFFSRGTPIRKRPKEVYSRKTFGHWELDTVVSPKGKSGCFATFIERKTRFYTVVKMQDRTAQSMQAAIKSLFHYAAFPSLHHRYYRPRRRVCLL